MTIGLLLDLLGIRKGQSAFNHQSCPYQEMMFPHMSHAKNCNDVPYVLNFVFDIVFHIATLLTEVGQNQLNYAQDFLKMRKRHFTIKRLIVKEHKLTRKALNKIGVGNDPPDKDLEGRRVFNAILDDIKAVKIQVDENKEKLLNLLDNISRLSLKEITKNIQDATKAQNKLLSSEFIDLKDEVSRLISEVKFDPENPKPTEIRTEENSKQILVLSKKVIPLVEKVNKTLEDASAILRNLSAPPS